VELLENEVKLVIISGTSYENIAGGKLHELIDRKLLKNLYLGLGRGSFNYGFDEMGNLKILGGVLPKKEEVIKIHEVCFKLHKYLLSKYNYETDIVFSRPGYCKIDLLVGLDRQGKLFLQPEEIDMVTQRLKFYGYKKGIKGLMDYAGEIGKTVGIDVKVTTDAKYLEVGMSTKGDNVDSLLEEVILSKAIKIEDCCFWGDEFTYLGEGVQGSDAYMITDKSRKGDFFDVSEAPLGLPPEVKAVGGSVNSFLNFLEKRGK
ncbi:HAD family hydrolase, partial [Paenibacillus sp. N3.4]|uniref:HAD family hydrolase n=1 Tax=Paenibacillus sp. N3.4 TaxID=2603222 RepID=UPI0011CAFD89